MADRKLSFSPRLPPSPRRGDARPVRRRHISEAGGSWQRLRDRCELQRRINERAAAAAELAQCTFRPSVRPLPRFIARMARPRGQRAARRSNEPRRQTWL